MFSVQLCWKTFGTKGKFYEKTTRRNNDENGCFGSRIHEGQAKGILFFCIFSWQRQGGNALLCLNLYHSHKSEFYLFLRDFCQHPKGSESYFVMWILDQGPMENDYLKKIIVVSVLTFLWYILACYIKCTVNFHGLPKNKLRDLALNRFEFPKCKMGQTRNTFIHM